MKRLILRTLLISSIALLGVQSASAVSIDFVPSVSSVNAGDTFSVDIVASGLGAAPADIVSAFAILVSYDSGVVTPTGYAFTGNLGIPDVETVNNDSVVSDPFTLAGFADLFEISLLSDTELLTLQSGLGSYPSVTLATLTFDANAGIDDGSNPNLGFVWDEFHDVKGNSIREVPIIIYPTSIPEPATVLLMAAGIAGLGLGRRKLRV